MFILVHPSSRVTSCLLLHSKDFHYKRSTRSIYSNSVTCNPQKYTAPAANSLLKPTADYRTIQTPLYIPKYILLIPSTSYKLYRTPCTHKIITPGNSQQKRIQYNERYTSFIAIQELLYKRLQKY